MEAGSEQPQAKCQLYVILARNAPTAIVFRRGPSKQVRLIRWNLSSDSFECGQWFKGRIYERRCDLSPSGQRLVYFASNGKRTWTAISNPPFLTALALWFNDSTWGGGGHFTTDNDVLINHLPGQMTPNPDQGQPKIRHSRGGELGGGGGEDDPICHVRMVRDGWQLVSEGVTGEYSYDQWASWVFSAPQLYEKQNGMPGKRKRVLRQNLRAIGEKQGDTYVLDYEVDGVSLGRCHWADWDRSGDLLISRSGRLLRAAYPYEEEREIADFGNQEFEPVVPTKLSKSW
ncbi:MAG: hypothetical protein JKY37_10595 [Nannocystaceae bacterium]|nr:hypothetical protein [Nannocystaceae bacterium]